MTCAAWKCSSALLLLTNRVRSACVGAARADCRRHHHLSHCARAGNHWPGIVVAVMELYLAWAYSRRVPTHASRENNGRVQTDGKIP